MSESASVPPGSDTPTDQEGQPFTEEELIWLRDAIHAAFHDLAVDCPCECFEDEIFEFECAAAAAFRALAEAGRLLPAGTEPLGYEVVIRNEHPALPPWTTDWDGKIHRTAAAAATALANAQAAGYEGTVAALVGPWEVVDENSDLIFAVDRDGNRYVRLADEAGDS